MVLDHILFQGKKWIDADKQKSTNQNTLNQIQIHYHRIASDNLYFDDNGQLQYKPDGGVISLLTCLVSRLATSSERVVVAW